MIDFELENNDLNNKLISGIEAKIQSINLRLTIHRRSFIYDGNLGSRLYLLLREKPSNWEKLGKIYVQEALEDEPDIEIINILYKPISKTKIMISVFFTWKERTYSTEVIID